MSLAELIAQLRAVLREHGDLPVFSAGELKTIPRVEVYDKGFEWVEGHRHEVFPAGRKAVLIGSVLIWEPKEEFTQRT